MAALELAPPLTAYGTCAQWNVNGFPFFQFSPATADPFKEVVPFIRTAYGLARKGPVDYRKTPVSVPGYREKVKGSLNVAGKPPRQSLPDDELVHIMFAYWPEIAREPPPRNAKVAYIWRLWWSADTFDAAFRRFDAVGQIVPVHDLQRQPFEELAEILGASSQLEELVKYL